MGVFAVQKALEKQTLQAVAIQAGKLTLENI
jgi:hypothetical protein